MSFWHLWPSPAIVVEERQNVLFQWSLRPPKPSIIQKAKKYKKIKLCRTIQKTLWGKCNFPFDWSWIRGRRRRDFKPRACVCSVFPDHMAQAFWKCGWSCYGDMSNVQHAVLHNCHVSHSPFFQALTCVRVTAVWPYSGGLHLDQTSIKGPHQCEAGVVPKPCWC